MSVENYLRNLGYNVSGTMKAHINNWHNWYVGKVPSFHNYSVWNGKKNISCERLSLQLAKTVCETWADFLFNEKVIITIDDVKIKEWIDNIFDYNNFYVMINQYQEYKAALGTVAYVPFIKNAVIDENTGEMTTAEAIGMNYITADKIIPLSWENGIINEMAVYDFRTEKKKNYAYIQLFRIGDDGNYLIDNKLIEIMSNGGSAELELNTLSEFAKLAKTIETGSPIKPFIIDRLAIANNIEIGSPFGISVFAKSIDNIKSIDMIYDSFYNEFDLGRRRIMVTAEAINITDSGQPTFKDDNVFFIIPKTGVNNEKPFIQEIVSTLREDEHEKALLFQLNTFSANCGLGENFYRYGGGSIATATQVISENSKLFRTLKKHEIILEAVLIDLIRLIISLGNRAMGLNFDEKVNIKIKFDDSIIEDKNSEMNRDLQLVMSGIMTEETYRVKWGIENIVSANDDNIDTQFVDEVYT